MMRSNSSAAAGPMLLAHSTRREGFLVFICWAIAMQIRFQRRMVSEFSYDGFTFQFRTLGIRQAQTRPVSQIEVVRDWRGRGGPMGYRIVFRDRGKVYLAYSVTNAGRVGEPLRSDISGPGEFSCPRRSGPPSCKRSPASTLAT